MFILLTVVFLFFGALVLVVLRWFRPAAGSIWLIAAGGGLLAWASVLLWQFRLPLVFQLPRWEPAHLFLESLSFSADALSWPYAFSIVSLLLAVILTAPARGNFPDALQWAASFVLGGLGVLAVLADNPLSLLMVWAAIDLAELVTQLRSASGSQASAKVVNAFATRVAGIGMLLWASMVSISAGQVMNFQNVPPQAGLYLLLAAGLRLGVFPLHLPYAPDTAIRRGFGSMLRLVSVASSLILLARIPSAGILSRLTSFLLFLTVMAALYAGWMWLRFPDSINSRPYWIIGLTALAMASALRANPVGAAAWSCALVLAGGALFLSSAYHLWLKRALWVGLWGISALPLTLTSTGWEGGADLSAGSIFMALIWPALLVAHAFLLAGYYRHLTSLSAQAPLDTLDRPVRLVYPLGIGVLLLVLVLLGVWGWQGAFQMGAWLPALSSVLLAGVVLWLWPRLSLLSPMRAHWVRPADTATWMDWLFDFLWGLYRLLGRVSHALLSIFEGEGGILWALLFLAFFLTLLTQRVSLP
ncbi:MAG: hypothetical protein Fur0043_15200 [Anaerolineales bacterium]